MAPVSRVTETENSEVASLYCLGGASELGQPVDGRVRVLEGLCFLQEAAGDAYGERYLATLPSMTCEQPGAGVLAQGIGVDPASMPSETSS